MSSEERRVIDYFIVAGLPENPVPLKDLPQKPGLMKWPIIDVTIINKSQGELAPEGFHCVEFTPSRQPANLNHGSVLAPEMYLCFRRGWNKPPIIDLGVLYSGKDLPKVGCQVLTNTPYGRSANVNNTGGEKIYVTYRRADGTADSDSWAVVDICVILPGKNEEPPHAFRKIDKNLNKGMLGSDVFLCYKKSIVKNNSLNYEAGILFRYPSEDWKDFSLPHQVAMFCLPLGAAIESWPPEARHPLPLFSTFVLTGATGEKVYGAAVIFYEEFDQERLKSDQATMLGLRSPRKGLTVHQNQSICILSRWPFFDTFKQFLLTLYRISVSGPQQLPLERHIGHFMSEVPFPSRERPRILVQLSTESVMLLLPEETPLPKSGASFIKMLMNLGPDNIISLLFYVLMEHRILIHSLRPDLLTSIAEAVVSMIFPFRWQCPYIPLCPLQLSPVLDSPTPFIFGLDSRYFDMFEPPPDITFVDLDTCTITVSEERRSDSASLLPRRPVRVLRSALEDLYDQYLDASQPATPDELDRHGVLNSHAFKGRRKMEMLELSIQQAFLRFMASILKDYEKFLLPATNAAGDRHVTSVDSLFNIQGFLSSREKASRNFYRKLMRTQYFSRFIDERSFVSDENIGLAFFDDCIHKQEVEGDNVILLELDDSATLSERTVFILPPEPPPSSHDVKFTYKGFAQLQPSLFSQQTQETTKASVANAVSSTTTGSILRRTKHELKSFQKALSQFLDQAEPMARCFVWICYSLWFMCLPAHLQNVPSRFRSFEEALEVLCRMHRLQMQPLDEVPYRILMHLCCVYNRPVFAVKIYHEMKLNQIQPNAITYGFYNKAVVDSNWTSSVTNGTRAWAKLRNIMLATIKFRAFCQEQRMQCSRTSDTLKTSDSETSDISKFYDSGISETTKTIESGTVSATSQHQPKAENDTNIYEPSDDMNNHEPSDDVDNRPFDSNSLVSCNSAHESQPDSSCESESTSSDNPKGTPRPVSVLTPVTENDPLGVFGRQSVVELPQQQLQLDGTCDTSSLDHRKNSGLVAEASSSKSKSCDGLASGELRVSSASLPTRSRRRGSFDIENKPQASETPDYCSKTLSRLDKLKSEERKANIPRTGSFGSAWNSAVMLINSTYQTLIDSLSSGASSQNINEGSSDVSVDSSSLLPLESEQRAHSANDVSFQWGGSSSLDRKHVDGGLTIDAGSERDSVDGRGGIDLSKQHSGSSIEAYLCTQSKCPNCANLLHDEEIMAGWSLNESNLQTRCLCCGYNFVPMISVILRDFRGVNRSTAPSGKNSSLNLNSSQTSDKSLAKQSESNEKHVGSDGECNNRSNAGSDIVDGNSIGRTRSHAGAPEISDVGVGKDRKQSDSSQGSSSNIFADDGSRKNFNGHFFKEEFLTVAYLSPLVLKKEMENLVELRGEDCLSKPQLINDHPIIFWNLVYFFRRLHLPSHLNNFISYSTVFDTSDMESENLQPEKSCNVMVRTLWDGMHMHKEFGFPMYFLWKYPEMAAKVSSEVMAFDERFMRSILICIEHDDIQLAIEKVLTERKRVPRTGKVLYRSIYYDMLFLSLVDLRVKFSIEKFDVLYKEACNDLPPAFSARLMEADRPPRSSTIWCRRLFGLLDL